VPADVEVEWQRLRENMAAFMRSEAQRVDALKSFLRRYAEHSSEIRERAAELVRRYVTQRLEAARVLEMQEPTGARVVSAATTRGVARHRQKSKHKGR